MGHYRAVWSSAIVDGQYVPWQGVRERLCNDLKHLLQDPHPRLKLALKGARYTPDQQQTVISFATKLTFSVTRWEGVPIQVHRAGRGWCLSDEQDQDGCRVEWNNGDFAGAATHLGFTLEADTSPLRAPFVVLEWEQPGVTLLMLFKKQAEKQADTVHEELTREEKARLGIGMTHQEMDAARVLATLQRKWVVFDNDRKTDPIEDGPVHASSAVGR